MSEGMRARWRRMVIHFAGTRALQRRSAVLMDWQTGILHRSQVVMGSETRLGPINGAFRSSFEAAINVIGTNNETDDND